jgi:hypothetical protein
VKRVTCTSSLLSLTLLLVSTTAGASITKKAAGKQYVKDVAPLNVSISKFNSELLKWTNSTTDAQGENDAKPLITSMQDFQNKLLGQSWPSAAKHDVRVLYNAISPLEADLENISDASALNDGTFSSKFNMDSAVVGSDSNIVRHDLGLPLIS